MASGFQSKTTPPRSKITFRTQDLSRPLTYDRSYILANIQQLHHLLTGLGSVACQMYSALARDSSAAESCRDSLNDDRSDHARMDRACEAICTRLVEFVREAFVCIHSAGLEHSRVADHGVRLVVLVGPGHGRACLDGQRRGYEHDIPDLDLSRIRG